MDWEEGGIFLRKKKNKRDGKKGEKGDGLMHEGEGRKSETKKKAARTHVREVDPEWNRGGHAGGKIRAAEEEVHEGLRLLAGGRSRPEGRWRND